MRWSLTADVVRTHSMVESAPRARALSAGLVSTGSVALCGEWPAPPMSNVLLPATCSGFASVHRETEQTLA